MNRIILIGNGFDLAHGLETGYCHFVNDYWKGIAKKIPEYTFAGFEDEFVKFERIGGPESSIDAYSATTYGVARNFKNEGNYRYSDHLGQGIVPEFHKALTEVESYLDLKELIAEVNDLSDLRFKLSFINSFFGHLSETLALNSWVDIENEYYQQLGNIALCEHPKLESVKKLHDDFDQVKSLLTEYLKKACGKGVERNESIGAIMNSLVRLEDIAISEQDTFLNIVSSNYFSGMFRREYEEIQKSHPEYYELMSEEEADRALIREKIIDDELNDFLLPDRTLLLSFNYTDTADNLYAKSEERADYNVIHIHGKLANSDNPIIFGYGDEMDDSYKKIVDLNKNGYLKNIKSIRYLETGHYRSLLSFIDSAPYQVFIMGHSCGNSDRTLLNTLFEHKNCISIKPFYHQKEDGTDDYIDIVQNISRNFKDAVSMRDRVVNKTYCHPMPQNPRR